MAPPAAGSRCGPAGERWSSGEYPRFVFEIPIRVMHIPQRRKRHGSERRELNTQRGRFALRLLLAGYRVLMDLAHVEALLIQGEGVHSGRRIGYRAPHVEAGGGP